MPIHQQLYDFWVRSIGVWDSPLVTVTVNWLEQKELLAIAQIHQLKQVEFGVNMSWKYHQKPQSGWMFWCVDTQQSNLVFTNKTLTKDEPCILNYQMLSTNKLVITVGTLEETFILTSGGRRLRELRHEGKLLRRLWETKIDAISPKLAMVS